MQLEYPITFFLSKNVRSVSASSNWPKPNYNLMASQIFVSSSGEVDEQGLSNRKETNPLRARRSSS